MRFYQDNKIVVNIVAREFLREHAVETVGLKRTGNRCLGGGSRGNCR